jgi:serine/threonine protein kinase
MPSSRITAFAEPDNDGERRVICYLDERLPAEYRIYHSLERYDRGQTYEWDVIVLAPHALYCLEVKDWRGRIVGNDREWVLGDGVLRRNPYWLANKKAQILKHRLTGADAFLQRVWTQALVVISDDRTELKLEGDSAQFVITLRDVVARLTDMGNQQWAGQDLRASFAKIHDVLTRDFRPATPERDIAQFRLLEQIGASDLYTEWRAENRFLAKPVAVRLKIYAPDPYLPAEKQAEQLRLISRDFEATQRLGSHPNLRTARDFFPTGDGGRYVLVLDDLPGTTLAGELIAGHSLTYEYKLRVIEDVAAGLAHTHACKVVHRDVKPANIWLAPASAVLVNFDCARLGNGGTSTITCAITESLDDRYLAPEVAISASNATVASDAYALGVVLYELLTGRLPSKTGVVAPPSTFDTLVDADLDKLTLRMLSQDQPERPSAEEIRDALAKLRDQRRAPTRTPADTSRQGGETGLDYQLGDTIDGQYLVRAPLGQGTFGKVYRVYSAPMDREYSLKLFLDPGMGLSDARQEFKALEELVHPRIARVRFAGLLRQGVYYLLTDYVDGQSLDKLLAANRSMPSEAIRIASDLLGALSYLHRQGIVHRDVKPSNVIVSSAGAWLIDFSVAVRAERGGNDQAGTPLYMPPDIGDCGRAASRDLFGAGVVLYEMLTGRRPYDRVPQPEDAPHNPLVDRPDLSDEMVAVLRRAVAPGSATRFTSAEDFLVALDRVEDVLRPQRVIYHPADGITVTEEDRQRSDYNPYLKRFLTLYSQNRTDNSGTRGYDEVGRVTYVPTRLDTHLGLELKSGKYLLAIITGNAGDGKTAFLQSLEASIACDPDDPASVVRLPSGNGATFSLGGRLFQTNYDGSQNEGDRQNDEVLAEFFAPFAGSAQEIATRSDRVVRLIAINEGKLRDFFARRQAEFSWLAGAVEAHLEAGKPLPDGYLVVNLNDRSVVAGEPSILDRQIDSLCNPEFWAPCLHCQHIRRCPVKFNVDTLNHPDLGPRVRQRLVRLFEIAQLRGRMHLTMRSVRSALAYLLFGEDGCDEIASLLMSSGPSGEERLLWRYYYNALAADRLIASEEHSDVESDRLLRLLAEADVGLGANPEDDRDLYFSLTGEDRATTSALLPSLPGRADYDRELLRALADRLTAATASASNQDEAVIAGRQSLQAMLRRKAFFERSDVGWEQMLPYSMLLPVLTACQGDGKELNDLKTVIIQGINHGEGLSDVRDALVLRLARGVPGRVQSFREFPASDFVLRPAALAARNPYVEFSPSYLELVHRPGLNGDGRTRPTLRLSLDLIELLARMAGGYAPTAAEWRRSLVNVHVFRTLLAHEQYDRLVLVDRSRSERYRVEQHGGQILLAQEDGHDGGI